MQRIPIRESNVDAIRLEVPIPEGLDCSFMLRYLEKLVADGKARAQADLERDRLERDARREAMRGKGLGATLRRLSTRYLRKKKDKKK